MMIGLCLAHRSAAAQVPQTQQDEVNVDTLRFFSCSSCFFFHVLHVLHSLCLNNQMKVRKKEGSFKEDELVYQPKTFKS